MNRTIRAGVSELRPAAVHLLGVRLALKRFRTIVLRLDEFDLAAVLDRLLRAGDAERPANPPEKLSRIPTKPLPMACPQPADIARRAGHWQAKETDRRIFA